MKKVSKNDKIKTNAKSKKNYEDESEDNSNSSYSDGNEVFNLPKKNKKIRENKTNIKNGNNGKENKKLKECCVEENDEDKDFYDDEDEMSEEVKEDENEENNEHAEITDEEEDLEEIDNKPTEVDEEDNMIETHHLNMDMDVMNMKIKDIIEVLSDFKNKAEDGKSRSDYTQELKKFCKIFYDYNEDIMTLVMNLFAPNEAVEFLEASAGQRVMSIRTNTLKIKRRELAKILINRGVNLDPLAEWTKVGLKIYDSTVPVGATPEYLSGQYMLQSGSSFLPVMALEPKENEKVLDMCSAPGGKTTYIAQLMKNTGILVANDLKNERLKSLYFNLHRLGVKNSIITNYDGVALSKLYTNFDRVLLDAPCSGLGVISKDPSVKINRVSFIINILYIIIIFLYLYRLIKILLNVQEFKKN
jgi:ribosomal RNA methyltransferase Nop2